MSLFVYLTKECLEDIRDHRFENEVQRFAQRVEKDQRITLFDNFPPPYLKKRFTRQLRLLAADRHFGEHVVVCFYRLLIRGGREYEDFLANPRAYGDRNFAPLAADKELQKWLHDRLQQPLPAPKPDPSESERTYLWNVLASPSSSAEDIFVCESRDWVEMVQNRNVNEFLHRVLDKLVENVDNPAENTAHIQLSQPAGWSIILRHFPDQKKLFLAALITPETAGRKDKILSDYRELLEGQADEVAEADILRMSVRTYPVELLADEGAWLRAERDEAANLALSPEETKTLTSVHSMISGEEAVGFPLFINGRAGSGKSTILQYLYADYLQNYISNGLTAGARGPLYLTCSAQLLERSRQVVMSLLECSYRHLAKKKEIDEAKHKQFEKGIENCFQEFHQFLATLLTPEERMQRFHPDRYVDYPKFKELWQIKYAADPDARRHYPYDICWYVIRTYVKGLSVDGYIDPEEYQELPHAEKTLSKESFERIYGRVWNSWYKPLNNELSHWDDQDLVRHLLAEGRLEPLYPAIFADEAQDFTRIELEALFRLSLFSNRHLSPQELGRVPFAFAGDPFQTLNPTGFRWDAIKSSFVTKFIKALDPAQQSQVKDLNYHELGFNYRSSDSIVKVCNTIQALRCILFDIVSLHPQDTWRLDAPAPQVWYDRGDPEVGRNLREQSDITIILPCEEGEEAQFVANDNFLKAIVSTDESGVPQNVLSSMRSKGLEFNRVALYGFGSHNCSDSLLCALAEGKTFTREEQLTYEYFVNRLYVAASRPRRRLYVIDSQEGLQRLWRLFTDPDIQEALVNRIQRNKKEWESSLGSLQPGSAAHWNKGNEGDNLEVLADRYWSDGRLKRDPYLLRQAALAYNAVKQERRSRLCKALALRFEGKHKASGDLYLQEEAYDDALQSYWIGKDYSSVSDLCSKVNRLGSCLEARFSDFFSRTGTVPAGASLLQVLLGRLQDQKFCADVLGDGIWMHAINRLVDMLADRVPSGDFAQEWRTINAGVQSLEKRGFAVRTQNLARIAYELGDLDRALRLWDKSGDKNHDLYRSARQQRLMSLVREKKESELSPEELKDAAQGLISSEAFDEARRLLMHMGDCDGWPRLVAAVHRKHGSKSLSLYFTDMLRIAVRRGDWEVVIRFCRDRALHFGEKSIEDIFASEFAKDPWQFHSVAIAEMARSELLPSADNRSVRQHISDYLKLVCFDAPRSWTRYVNPHVAGAAFERAGRDIDCLQFYEEVYRSDLFKSPDKQKARARWVKCKLRQAEREEASGKKAIGRKHAAEGAARQSEWGIAEEDLRPDFPVISEGLGPLVPAGGGEAHVSAPAASAGAPVSAADAKVPGDSIEDKHQERPGSAGPVAIWKIGEFNIQFSKSDGRMNFARGTQTAGVRLKGRKCASMDVDFEEKQGVFSCKEWNIEVDLSHLDKTGVFEIRIPDQSVTIQIKARG